MEDLENPDLTITGMFAWDGSNGCTLAVADDVENPRVKRTHYFRFAGNTLYDFWLDDLAVDEVTRSAIQRAVVYLGSGHLSGRHGAAAGGSHVRRGYRF